MRIPETTQQTITDAYRGSNKSELCYGASMREFEELAGHKKVLPPSTVKTKKSKFDETRLQRLLKFLKVTDLTTNELSEKTGIPVETVRQQVNILKREGLVERNGKKGHAVLWCSV